MLNPMPSLPGCCFRHWEYELNKLEIISVDMSEDEEGGSILAAVQVCVTHGMKVNSRSSLVILLF